MNIYTDYANWKFENYSIVSTLVSQKSKVISRFSHVISVIEHLYAKHIKTNNDLAIDEEVIFESAFNYIYDHFNTITILLEKNFNNNVDELNKFSKTINLLLYINDFQNEVLNHELNNKSDIKLLDDLEQKVLTLIETKTEAADTYFALLNDITSKIFESNGIEYYAVNEIMYDIALAYDLIDENEDDSTSGFSKFLNNRIFKTV